VHLVDAKGLGGTYFLGESVERPPRLFVVWLLFAPFLWPEIHRSGFTCTCREDRPVCDRAVPEPGAQDQHSQRLVVLPQLSGSESSDRNCFPDFYL
jgi:hypothetical protein